MVSQNVNLISRTSQSRLAIISESFRGRFLYEAFLECLVLSCKAEEVFKSPNSVNSVCFINGVFSQLTIIFNSADFLQKVDSKFS